MIMYKVYDRTHQLIACFKTLEQAQKYKEVMGRPDWYIPSRKSTPRQQAAVEWCESIYDAIDQPRPFNGNINLFDDCSNYLNIYLDDAKAIMDDAMSGYPYEKYGY